MATATDIAYFLLAQLEHRGGLLLEADAAGEIEKRFGPQFVSQDRAGAVSVNRVVRDAFEALTAGTVIWDNRARQWRYNDGDDGGRIA